MGLYPFSPSNPENLVTLPIFDSVTWNLKNNTTLKLLKEGESREMKAIYLNGSKIEGFFVDHSIFDKGGEVLIKTGN